MKTLAHGRRGFAMMAALMLMALLAIIAISVLSFSSADRRRAIRVTRSEVRENCAWSGLNYARSYFATNMANWPTYLSAPQVYNPMALPVTTPAWSGLQTAGRTVNGDGTYPNASLTPARLAAVKAVNPSLLVDLDSDGQDDVYVFIRDNYDEFLPATPNFQADNDQNVIVGAICISSTMVPRREDNTVDTDQLVAEAMLSVNATGGYTSQAGNNNANNR